MGIRILDGSSANAIQQQIVVHDDLHTDDCNQTHLNKTFRMRPHSKQMAIQLSGVEHATGMRCADGNNAPGFSPDGFIWMERGLEPGFVIAAS